MGVVKKNLYFDGFDLADYNVFITGEAVYNAPERDVEIVSIPGRNGDLITDNGRFKNIEVTYPANLACENQADFAPTISLVRNQLASRKGYVRISDEYHPDEYRMGMFVGGMEVSPVANNIAGEFNLVFNCKPQRYLVSGEVPVTVTSGDSITNPTLFDSHPLLMVDGYGEIDINGSTVSITDVPLGTMSISSGGNSLSTSTTATATSSLDVSQLNSGDTITVGGLICTGGFAVSGYTISSVSGVYTSGDITFDSATFYHSTYARWSLSDSAALTFSYGTSGSYSGVYTMSATTASSVLTGTLTLTLAYDGDDTITFRRVLSVADGGTAVTPTIANSIVSISSITAYSTNGSLGEPLYLDLENGSAYKYENDTYISINSAVWLGTELPVLSPGVNDITFDNTVTELQIVPRWWTI